jgi:uncharacterized membrane protein (UPF0127 family)
MKIIDLNTGSLIADNLDWAKTFIKRFKGLMFKKSLQKGEGIVLVPCSSIHTFFMKFSIDVLFLDKKHTVLLQENALPPRKMIGPIKGARYVVELPSGTMEKHGNIEGHTISFYES